MSAIHHTLNIIVLLPERQLRWDYEVTLQIRTVSCIGCLVQVSLVCHMS